MEIEKQIRNFLQNRQNNEDEMKQIELFGYLLSYTYRLTVCGETCITMSFEESMIYYNMLKKYPNEKTLMAIQPYLKLNFHDAKITDVSMLGNVKSLDLTRCVGVTDVSMLGNVRTLKLSGMRLTDDAISKLGNNTVLWLDNNNKITNVAHLGNVYELNLTMCVGISTTVGLEKVKILNLTGLRITHVSNLCNVDTLILSGCYNIETFEKLGTVRKLDLTWTRITDVSPFVGVEELNLSYTRVVDVSMLHTVKTLRLCGCYCITDVSGLCGVQNLYLDGCVQLVDISALNGCPFHILSIRGCHKIETVDGLVANTLIR